MEVCTEKQHDWLSTLYLTHNIPMSYSPIVYPVKMEYGSKYNIFGLKMMKSGLEKIFLKFFHAQSLFQKVCFYYWICTFEHKSTFLWSKNDTFCVTSSNVHYQLENHFLSKDHSTLGTKIPFISNLKRPACAPQSVRTRKVYCIQIL